jgi:GT2 family glycosyltransferase
MGAGNNIGIREAKTDFVLILNPDVVLERNALEEIFLASSQLSNFSIIAPLEIKYANYNISKNKFLKNVNKNLPFEVNHVDGFAMLLNKNKLKEDVFFDENIFLYLENNDLCQRVINKGGSIFIVPKAKINHLAAKTVDDKFSEEVEFSRNWHWIWSKFYYNKKHFGFLKALKECFPSYFSSILKFTFYFLINNKIKKKIYFNRISGFFNALLGKSSWYRPNLED